MESQSDASLSSKIPILSTLKPLPQASTSVSSHLSLHIFHHNFKLSSSFHIHMLSSESSDFHFFRFYFMYLWIVSAPPPLLLPFPFPHRLLSMDPGIVPETPLPSHFCFRSRHSILLTLSYHLTHVPVLSLRLPLYLRTFAVTLLSPGPNRYTCKTNAHDPLSSSSFIIILSVLSLSLLHSHSVVPPPPNFLTSHSRRRRVVLSLSYVLLLPLPRLPLSPPASITIMHLPLYTFCHSLTLKTLGWCLSSCPYIVQTCISYSRGEKWDSGE